MSIIAELIFALLEGIGVGISSSKTSPNLLDRTAPAPDLDEEQVLKLFSQYGLIETSTNSILKTISDTARKDFLLLRPYTDFRRDLGIYKVGKRWSEIREAAQREAGNTAPIDWLAIHTVGDLFLAIAGSRNVSEVSLEKMK